MKTKLLYVLTLTIITTGNAAQHDAIILGNLARRTYQQSQNNAPTDRKEAPRRRTESSTNSKTSTPTAIRCIWVQLKPFLHPTNKEDEVGVIKFLDASGKVLHIVSYNPLDRWFIKGITLNGNIVTRRIQGPEPLKSIGAILGLNHSQIDTTEAAKAIDRWLARQSNR